MNGLSPAPRVSQSASSYRHPWFNSGNHGSSPNSGNDPSFPGYLNSNSARESSSLLGAQNHQYSRNESFADPNANPWSSTSMQFANFCENGAHDVMTNCDPYVASSVISDIFEPSTISYPFGPNGVPNFWSQENLENPPSNRISPLRSMNEPPLVTPATFSLPAVADHLPNGEPLHVNRASRKRRFSAVEDELSPIALPSLYPVSLTEPMSNHSEQLSTSQDSRSIQSPIPVHAANSSGLRSLSNPLAYKSSWGLSQSDHHPTSRSAITYNGLEPLRVRRHECAICHKRFDRPSTLRKHNLVHTGEKSLSCHFCGRPFGVRSNLNRHLKKCCLKDPPNTMGIQRVSEPSQSQPDTKRGTTVDSSSPEASSSTSTTVVTSPSTLNSDAAEGSRRTSDRKAGWIPESLRDFNLVSKDNYALVSVPLKPAIPMAPLIQGGFEERDSSDENVPPNPYHPSGWEPRKRLPGPSAKSD